MIFVFIFLLFLYPSNGQDLRILKNLQSRMEVSNDYANFDLPSLLEPLESFKHQNFYHHISSKLADIPNLNNLNITAECAEDLLLIGMAEIDKNNTSPELAAVFSQMMDATAKIPPGLQRGARNIFGFKQECDVINYKVPNQKRHFTTSYSRAYISLSGDCENLAASLGFDICLPSSCTSQDLMNVVAIIPEINATLANVTSLICAVSTFADINKPMTTGSWIMVAFLSILAALVILAGITDYCILPSDTPLRKQFGLALFLAFSGYKSVCEILIATKSKHGQIGPINCLRVISMFWVIYGHTISASIVTISNILDFMPILDYFLSEILLNAFFSVDTFFFIGGVLLSFMWFKNYEKDRKRLMSPQGWIMFYVHRIIRLSGPYWVALIAYTYLFGPLTQNMPYFFTAAQPEFNRCKKYLWKNMLYIQNLNVTEICMGPTWYLATDMQMFVLTPIILIPLALYPIAGWIVAAVLIVISTAGNIITVYENNYPPTVTVFGANAIVNDEQKTFNYSAHMYYAAWIRCQIYIMGLLVGWTLQKYKNLRINVILNFFLWVIGASLMLTVLFGLYHYNQGNSLQLFWRAAYSALSKPAWGLGLTWLIFSCYYGYGGPINQFMSWNIWVPLGRLSYCAYLVHYPIIDYVFGLDKNAIYYSSLWQISLNYFIPILTLTFTLAFVLAVLVEVPAGKLETILLRPRPRERHSKKDDGPSWEILDEPVIIKEKIVINGDIKF